MIHSSKSSSNFEPNALSHDSHIHTALSPCACADMSCHEILKRSKEKGLNRVVILDHIWGNQYNNKNAEEENIASKLREQRSLIKKEFEDIEIKVSGEFNFDESLANESLTQGFDFITAGVHSLNKFNIFISNAMPVNILSIIINRWGLEKILSHFVEQTITMFEDKRVLVGAHPFNLYLYLEGTGYSCIDHMLANAQNLAPALKDKGFEINSAIFRRTEAMIGASAPRRFQKCVDAYAELLARISDNVGFFTVSSDAHSLAEVGDLSWSDKVIEKAGIRNKLTLPPYFENEVAR